MVRGFQPDEPRPEKNSVMGRSNQLRGRNRPRVSFSSFILHLSGVQSPYVI